VRRKSSAPAKRGRGTTRSVVEGAFDFKLSKSSRIYRTALLAPHPPHFVRSPLPATAGRNGAEQVIRPRFYYLTF